MAAGREVVQVEGRSRGLVKPHTFEVDDERVDDRAAGLAAVPVLLRLGTVTVEFCIWAICPFLVGRLSRYSACCFYRLNWISYIVSICPM